MSGRSQRSSSKTDTAVIRGVILLLALIVSSCLGRSDERTSGAGENPRSSSDSAFAGVQERGQRAMGVDQYTSTHNFEPLPDGGRISLVRDPADSAGVARIREHMGRIVRAFADGDFTIPGFVHAGNVPGTAVMSARKSLIRYMTDSLPGGAQVRLQSLDPVAISAIHEFLAFQRHDHRVPNSGTPH